MLPVTVKSLIASLAAGQNDNLAPKAGGEGFSSLLDILGKSGDEAGEDSRQSDDEKDVPPAAAVGIPSIVFAEKTFETPSASDVGLNRPEEAPAPDGQELPPAAANDSAKETAPPAKQDEIAQEAVKPAAAKQKNNQNSSEEVAPPLAADAPASVQAGEDVDALQRKLSSIRRLLSDLLGILSQFGQQGAYVSISQTQTVTITSVAEFNFAGLFASSGATTGQPKLLGAEGEASQHVLLQYAQALAVFDAQQIAPLEADLSLLAAGDAGAVSALLDQLGKQIEFWLNQFRAGKGNFAAPKQDGVQDLVADLDAAVSDVSAKNTQGQLEKLLQHIEKAGQFFAGLLPQGKEQPDAPAFLDRPSQALADFSSSAPDTSSADAAPVAGLGNAALPQDTGAVRGAQGGTGNAASLAALAGGQAEGNGGDLAGSNDNLPGFQNAARLAPAQNTPAADKPAFVRLLNDTVRQPLADQVTFHIKNLIADGSSRIRIQLDPAELGKLDIKLDVASDGKTGITVTADRKETLDLLQKDARALERALAEAGLRADSGSLSFNLRGEGQQGQEFNQAASQYQKALPEEEDDPVQVLAKSYVVNLAEGLDIKI